MVMKKGNPFARGKMDGDADDKPMMAKKGKGGLKGKPGGFQKMAKKGKK